MVLVYVAASLLATILYIIFHPTGQNRGGCVATGFLFGLLGGITAFWIGFRLRQPRFIAVFLFALFPIIYWSRFLYIPPFLSS